MRRDLNVLFTLEGQRYEKQKKKRTVSRSPQMSYSTSKSLVLQIQKHCSVRNLLEIKVPVPVTAMTLSASDSNHLGCRK